MRWCHRDPPAGGDAVAMGLVTAEFMPSSRAASQRYTVDADTRSRPANSGTENPPWWRSSATRRPVGWNPAGGAPVRRGLPRRGRRRPVVFCRAAAAPLSAGSRSMPKMSARSPARTSSPAEASGNAMSPTTRSSASTSRRRKSSSGRSSSRLPTP